jgi:hypothetical protein
MIKYVFSDRPLSIKNAKTANPQKIGEALEEITATNNGRLEPDKIVAAARKDKRLNPYFEWNNAKAADAYRLEQARELVRLIHVENHDVETGLARGWYSIRDRDGVSYRAVAEILSSQDLQQRLMAQAEKDLLSWEARYRSISDVCEMVRVAREKLSERRAAGNRDRGAEKRV